MHANRSNSPASVQEGVDFMLGSMRLEHSCKAEISRAMAEEILSVFDGVGRRFDVLEVELRGNALYVLNPVSGIYEILGLAGNPPSMSKR